MIEYSDDITPVLIVAAWCALIITLFWCFYTLSLFCTKLEHVQYPVELQAIHESDRALIRDKFCFYCRRAENSTAEENGCHHVFIIYTPESRHTNGAPPPVYSPTNSSSFVPPVYSPTNSSSFVAISV
jgi:hypothetical protein